MILQRTFLSSSGRLLVGGAVCRASLFQNSSRAFSSAFSTQNKPLRNYCPINAQRLFHTSRASLRAESADDPKAAEDPKLITNEEWAKRLNPEQYFCTRENGTEPPFSGQYLTHKAEGIYGCVCCGSELFTSKSKYDSGSGWPSFHTATANVIRRKDISHGMVRVEILCNHCNAHLGHVFEDGPAPSRERHCVNSAALKFVPKKL